MKKANRHIGSNFDDFLKEEDVLEETQAVAIKRVIAYQFMKVMKTKKISKVEMVTRMHTKSRAQLDRLLDPTNTSVTLLTLEKAANALDKRLSFQLV